MKRRDEQWPTTTQLNITTIIVIIMLVISIVVPLIVKKCKDIQTKPQIETFFNYNYHNKRK